MYQKEWEWFLLGFSVQEWEHMNKTMKSFLKKLKITFLKGVREKEGAVVRDRIEIVISYKNIEHVIDLVSSDMEGYSYITFDFDELDKVFGLKLSKDEMKKIEKHFIDFFVEELKDKIEYEVIVKNRVEESLERVGGEEEEGFIVNEEEKKLLYAVVKEWYDDGFATWQYRGAPGEDGKFGGSFHYLPDDLEEHKNGFTFVIDFGSADDKQALYDLAHRVKELGYEVDTGEYYNEIYIMPKKINF